MEKLQKILAQIKLLFDRLLVVGSTVLEKGGIRLKLTAIMAFIVIAAVLALSSVIMPFQERSISRKAFDMCEVSAISISSAAVEAILTGQSALLRDILRGIMDQKIEGLMEAAVIFQGRYFVNSVRTKDSQAVPDELLNKIRDLRESGIVTNKTAYTDVQNQEIEAYEFITPIFYQNKRIGFTRIVYDNDAIQKEISYVKNLTLIVASAVVFVSLIIIYFVGLRVARPILEVAAAAGRVGQGDLEFSLKIKSLDEVGTLAKQFNRMVGELREKLQMMKFVSQSTAKMIQEHSHAGEVQLGGRRDELAFFFSDVRGFTSWSEKNTPEVVITVLNEYLDMQSVIIKNNGGDIDKYVGDEIMAVFTGENKEDRCLQAAIEIIDAINAKNERRKRKGFDILDIGIGVHTGEVVVGNVGSQYRMDFTAIGDNVNLAARLCSSAKPAQILASGVLIKKVKNQYTLRELEPIQVKGKKLAIEIYDVVGLKSRAA